MVSLKHYENRVHAANETALRDMILAAYRQMLRRPDDRLWVRRLDPESVNRRIDLLWLECQARSRMEIFWEARDAVLVEFAKQKGN